MTSNPAQTAGSSTARRVVAAFDVDGTLVPGDSLLPFVWRHVGRRRFLLASARHGLRVGLATGAGIGSRDAAKARFVSTALRRQIEADLIEAGRRYAEDLAKRAHPAALARVEWHRRRGDELVMISASLTLYLQPLADRLGFDAVLATDLEPGVGGRLSGALLGANVRGPEKVARLERWLDGADCELWAYGDSAGDRELLARADHGYLIPHNRFAVEEI